MPAWCRHATANPFACFGSPQKEPGWVGGWWWGVQIHGHCGDLFACTQDWSVGAEPTHYSIHTCSGMASLHCEKLICPKI